MARPQQRGGLDGAASRAWTQALAPTPDAAEACRWGIEGTWGYGRGLAQHLVAAGEAVCEINTRWTAQERCRARNRSKTDGRDAQAIALYTWREGAALPYVAADDGTAVLEVLVTQHDAAVAEATRLRNQAHQLLLQCDPTYRDRLPALTTEGGSRRWSDTKHRGTAVLAV